MADWSRFVELAIDASNHWQNYCRFIRDCNKEYGTEHSARVLSGGAHESWPQHAKRHARFCLALFYDAQDKALKAKPPRVHKRTALNRLRQILEN